MQLLHLLVALAAVSLAVCNAQQQPRFQVTGTRGTIHSFLDAWFAGQPSSQLVVAKKTEANIRVQLQGGTCTNERQTLLYKCPDSTQFRSIALNSLAESRSRTMCAGVESGETAATLPMMLLKSGSDFTLKVPDSSTHPNKIPFSETFTKNLEIKVKVECNEVTLLSNSLFVTNLVAMQKANAERIRRDYISRAIHRRFLTENGLRFMAQMQLASEEFGSVDLIDMSVINAIKAAPALIQSKIDFGAFISKGSRPCQAVDKDSSLTLVTYDVGMTSGLIKTIFLNKDDGRLHYSTYGLSKAVSDKLSSGAIALCVVISINGEKIASSQVLSVTLPYSLPADTPYKQQGSLNSNCKAIDGVPKTVDVFTGSDDTIIACPIVCSRHNQDFQFSHKGASLTAGSSVWKDYAGVKVHRSGKFLKFTKDVSASKAGEYSCSAASASFSFTVNVVSMPHFTKSLPHRIFAMEGGNYNFTCTAAFSNLGSVTAAAQFYTNQVDLSKPEWTKLNKRSFNMMVAGGAGAAIAVNENTDSGRSLLTVGVSSVPPAVKLTNKNFTHRFVCDVSVGASDAVKLGMPSYSVQSSTDVFFVARPKMLNFVINDVDCSAEGRCKAEKGERFSVSLRPELSSYLNRIGVEVDADFRVGNHRLQEVLAGFVGPADSSQCNITFNSSNNTLVFTVNQINDLELVRKLSGLNVTPVFNFRYRKDWDLGNLGFRVESGKSLLLADRKCDVAHRCFYSTDFDVDAELSGLKFFVDFSGKVVPTTGPPPTKAGAGLFIGILVAILILVIIVALIVFLIRRDPGQTYLLDEKERQQGNHPEQEAKDEQFKEYQRPEEGPLKASRISLASDFSAASKDDQELDNYRDDDIDFTKFGEDGSFIAEYTTADQRKRDAFNAAARNEHQV